MGVDVLEEEDEEEDDYRVFYKFLKGVIKHFSAEIAARVTYVVNYLARFYGEVNFEHRNEVQPHIRELDGLSIWEGRDEINSIIYEAMVKWIEVVRKDDNEDEDEN